MKNNYTPYITEADFQKQVIELAHLFGWKVCEFRKARLKKRGQDTYRTPFGADGAGFPDLILIRDNVLLVVELKSERGKTTPAQEQWLSAFTKAGVISRVWRPSDWDTIVLTLQGLPGQPLAAKAASLGKGEKNG